MVGCEPVDILSFCSISIQGEAEQAAKILAHHAQQLDLSLLNKARQAETGLIRVLNKPFRWRSANYFSKLSLDIRSIRKLEALKVKVEPWILKNVAT